MKEENKKKYPNLTRTSFKPGKSGNPAGMKKGTKYLTPIIRKVLTMTWKQFNEEGKAIVKTGAEWQVLKLFRTALGDGKDAMTAMKLLLQYADGLPEQAIKVSPGVEDVNVEFNVSFIKKEITDIPPVDDADN